MCFSSAILRPVSVRPLREILCYSWQSTTEDPWDCFPMSLCVGNMALPPGSLYMAPGSTRAWGPKNPPTPVPTSSSSARPIRWRRTSTGCGLSARPLKYTKLTIIYLGYGPTRPGTRSSGRVLPKLLKNSSVRARRISHATEMLPLARRPCVSGWRRSQFQGWRELEVPNWSGLGSY